MSTAPFDESSDGVTIVPTRRAFGSYLIRVFGEIDLLTVPQCAQALRDAVRDARSGSDDGGAGTAEEPERSPRGHVVCDLHGVTFFGASGLGMLVEIDREAREAGVDLVLVAGRTVRRPLTLAGLDRRFHTRPGLVMALDALEQVQS